jgi:Glucose-repressible protein Grg1
MRKQNLCTISMLIRPLGATASKEANKEVAKDSNAALSTRAQAAGDAIGDKVDEQTHNRKADV